MEVTAESVQVLFQIHIEEGESSHLVIQCHSYSYRVHCNPEVRTPTVMKKLIFMPKEKRGEGNMIILDISICLNRNISYSVWDKFPTQPLVKHSE